MLKRATVFFSPFFMGSNGGDQENIDFNKDGSFWKETSQQHIKTQRIDNSNHFEEKEIHETRLWPLVCSDSDDSVPRERLEVLPI